LAAGLALLALAAAPPRPEPVLFPAGTVLPIRFLHGLAGGRSPVGSEVLVQTLAALVKDSCVVVEPFTHVLGHVASSRQGRRFGRPGELALVFDSLEVSPHRWQPIGAVLDSAEYASPGEISSAGELAGGRRPTRGRYVRAGAFIGMGALMEEGVIPVALLEGWHLIRRGPRPTIMAGEVARLRLTEPLKVLRGNACVQTATHEDLTRVPSLPRFVPRTGDDRAGKHPGDPINVILMGSLAEIDTAFARASWVHAQAPSLRSLARGVTAAVVERKAVGAPVSTQYFEGRKQDLTYELSGPNARFRHHVRIWLLDDTTLTWVAAADEDIGLVVNPFRRTATHRISPRMDDERDLVVSELEATGCATLVSYLELPDAVTSGRNASGQRFRTDGRAAAIRFRKCW
ncbi:MAG TPA: LssY C-terminal domain-containing protein, partial [Longimicrobiales bacterium]